MSVQANSVPAVLVLLGNGNKGDYVTKTTFINHSHTNTH